MDKLLRDALLIVFAFVVTGGLLDSIGVVSTILVFIVGGCLYFGWGLLFNLKGNRK